MLNANRTNKYISIFFIFFVSFQLINSQSFTKQDSIRNLLNLYKYREAIAAIDKLPANESLKPTYLNMKGQAYKGLFQYNEAIKYFTNIQQKDTNNLSAVTEIAYLYKNLSDYGNALRYFEAAHSIDTTFITAKLEIAGIHFALENFDKAKNTYLFYYQRDTNNIYLIKNIARCYEGLDIPDSAITFYRKVVMLNTSDFASVYKLCSLLAKVKKYKEAIAYSDQYRQSDSSNLRINKQNAFLYMMDKKYLTATLKFKNCYNNKDTSLYVTRYLGICYFKTDSFETAKYYLDKAYALDTTDITTIQFLAQACTESYYKELGVIYSKKAIQLATPAPEYLATLYKNLYVACRGFANCPCETRLESSLKSYEYNPKDTFAIYDIATCYDGCRKDMPNAIKYYTEFISTRPPKKPENDNTTKGLIISIYDMAERRLKEIKAQKTNN